MFHRVALKQFLPTCRELILLRDPMQLYLSSRKRIRIDGKRLHSKEQYASHLTLDWTKRWFNEYFKRIEKLYENSEDGVQYIHYEKFLEDPDFFLNLQILEDISLNRPPDNLKVKGKNSEKIAVRDKKPEEWLSKDELNYVNKFLSDNKTRLFDLGLSTAA